MVLDGLRHEFFSNSPNAVVQVLRQPEYSLRATSDRGEFNRGGHLPARTDFGCYVDPCPWGRSGPIRLGSLEIRMANAMAFCQVPGINTSVLDIAGILSDTDWPLSGTESTLLR